MCQSPMSPTVASERRAKEKTEALTHRNAVCCRQIAKLVITIESLLRHPDGHLDCIVEVVIPCLICERCIDVIHGRDDRGEIRSAARKKLGRMFEDLAQKTIEISRGSPERPKQRAAA